MNEDANLLRTCADAHHAQLRAIEALNRLTAKIVPEHVLGRIRGAQLIAVAELEHIVSVFHEEARKIVAKHE